MLDTNDLKARFRRSPHEIANAVVALYADGCLPTFQGELHGWLVKRRYLGVGRIFTLDNH